MVPKLSRILFVKTVRHRSLILGHKLTLRSYWFEAFNPAATASSLLENFPCLILCRLVIIDSTIIFPSNNAEHKAYVLKIGLATKTSISPFSKEKHILNLVKVQYVNYFQRPRKVFLDSYGNVVEQKKQKMMMDNWQWRG